MHSKAAAFLPSLRGLSVALLAHVLTRASTKQALHCGLEKRNECWAGGSRGWLAEHGPSPVTAADAAVSCAEALLTCQQVKRQEVLGFMWVFFLKQPSLESGSAQLADRSTKKNI